MRVMIQLMLVFALVLGQIPISVFAQTAVTENVLATGSYTIEQDVLKSDSDEVSSAGKFLQTESTLEVTEAGMKLTLTYTAGSLMSNLKVRVNGEEVDFTQEVNGSGMASTLALTFDIKDLSDEISMDMTIMGTMNHTVRILLKEETLKLVSGGEVTLPTPEVNKIQVGSYTIEQDVLKPDSDEVSSAGKFLQTESALEVTEAGMKLTLTYTAGSLMSNLKVRVNGEEVDFTQEVDGSGMASTLALTFDIKDLSDEISMDMTIMGTMNHTVRILLKEETLKSVSEDESDEVEGGNTESGSESGEDEGGNTGSESGSDKVEGENSGAQEDKVVYYTIEQNVFKPGTTEVSMAGDFLKQESKIKETKDKKELTLTFNMGNMISRIKVRVNGKEVAVKQRLVGEGDDSTLALTFEIGSLDDKISMDMTIMGFMNHTVDIVLKPETLKKVNADDFIENDSITESTGGSVGSGNTGVIGGTLTQGSSSQTDKTPTVTESQLVSVNDLVDGQTYIIKNDVYSSVSTPRQALNTSSYLEVKNGAYYVTFGFGLMDYMNNLRISVNGSQVSYDVLRSTATTMDLKFKMNSLTDKIMVTAYVPAISRDVTFEVKLLTNAIYTISANQANQGLGKDTVMQMSTAVEEEEEVAEELEVSDYIKRYSIKNEVLSDSELGLSMARKYLNEESLLEEVDGVLYLSLTLSGTDMMQNIRFKVNGEIVDHELTLDDTENHYKTYRFMLGSVEDEIEALMYIIPSGRDISFGIRLLPETQTLLSETTLEVQAEVEMNDEEIEALADEIQAKEIKQSNADVMMAAIISMGTLSVVGASVYFMYKKKNKTKA
ncbi:heme uptake protein IsdC [Turicibacter sanguinis]|nr:heme uptake protein IsdC [Turicibacter sanguinis]